MKLQKFDLKKHGAFMYSWLILRGAYVPREYEMPEIGFVAIYRKTPVGIMFIRRIEGGSALLDGLVTNPDSSSELRHMSIELLTNRCLREAKSLNISNIMAFTSDAGPLKRSAAHGFTHLADHAILVAAL